MQVFPTLVCIAFRCEWPSLNIHQMSLRLTPHKTHESFAPVYIIEVYSMNVLVDSG